MLEILEDSHIAPITEEETRIPVWGSADWSDYVLSQFRDEELDNNAPKCDGLRRVAEQLIGPIVSTRIVKSELHRQPVDIATVVVGIEIVVHNTRHPAYSEAVNTIYVEDIADCGLHNTEKTYAIHASATAATRAEARALRKVLRIRGIIAAEEAGEINEEYISGGWKPDDPIEDTQISVIDLQCKRQNINVLNLVNSGKTKVDNIEQLSKATACQIIQYLSDIQRGEKQLAVGIGTYDPDWRKK